MICGKDDSGICCGVCDYNPVVVIATHQRKEITATNIRLLKNQTFIPKVVVVCSDKEEFEFYKAMDVSVVFTENKPLGKKWQVGVNAAIKLEANPLVIVGSDDILHPEYIMKGLQKLKQGFEFVGTTAWYTYDVKRNNLYENTYRGVNIDFPIGSGKMYSKDLLTKIRGKVFDMTADRKLDDQGQRMIKGMNASIYLIREPMILAVKGNWNEMNKVEAYLRSPNIRTIKSDTKVLKKFNYTI